MSTISGQLPRLPFTLPVRLFVKWACILIVIIALVGTWLAHTIVSTRQADYEAEIKARVAIQAAGRADVMAEFLGGQLALADNLVSSDLVRLFATEVGASNQNLNQMEDEGGIGADSTYSALMAQLPYMQQTIKDFTNRNNLKAAYLFNQSGNAFLSSRSLKEFTAVQQQGVARVFNEKKPIVLPMRRTDNQLVLDMLKPVFALDDNGEKTRVVSVLMMTVPIENRLPEILSLGPLANPGEAAVLLQIQDGNILQYLGTDEIKRLAFTLEDFKNYLQSGEATLQHPVFDQDAFLSYAPVVDTPFAVMVSYDANQALAFMELYRNGVYGIVSLASLTLIAFTLLIIGHLLAQRNRTRVKHQGNTMQALVRAIEIRDPHLAGHHNAMARLAVQLGNDLDLPVRQRSTLYYAAQLSGVGKVFVPQDILTKKGKLTQEERQKLEEHVHHAMDVLDGIDFELPIKQVVAQMAERMDGTGYPEKLKGEQINILSRILAVADVYCALIKPRSYREALTPEDAIAQLRSEETRYDQKVVDALEDRVKGQPRNARV